MTVQKRYAALRITPLCHSEQSEESSVLTKISAKKRPKIGRFSVDDYY